MVEFRFRVNVQVDLLLSSANRCQLPSLGFQIINAMGKMTAISILKLKRIVFNVESEDRRRPCRFMHVTPFYREKRLLIGTDPIIKMGF